jgi:hypothetical protein
MLFSIFPENIDESETDFDSNKKYCFVTTDSSEQEPEKN